MVTNVYRDRERERERDKSNNNNDDNNNNNNNNSINNNHKEKTHNKSCLKPGHSPPYHQPDIISVRTQVM